MDALHPRSDACENIPHDGIRQRCNLGGRNVRPEEFHLIAAPYIAVIGQDDDHLIHRDPSDDGMASAPDESFRPFP